MNALADNIIVALAILAAIAFFARGFFSKKKNGCSSGCGCEVAKKPEPHSRRAP